MTGAQQAPRRPVGCAQHLNRGGELVASTVMLGRGKVAELSGEALYVDTFTHRIGVRYAGVSAEWLVVIDVHHAGDASPYATRVMGRGAGWDLETASQVAAFEVDDMTDGPPHFSGPWIGGAS